MNRIIRIGTRDSPLAISQTIEVQKCLHRLGYCSHLFFIKSEGDLIQNISLYKFKKVGIFTRNLTNVILSGKIDMALPSL
ncbi:hypothetical protein [Blattabacterium cuenoti]|uniref:hypothetical protein n=1 Tax=Blattabacterium cuenoti TaxID=1653831 RepID=UPI001EEA590B|nr:hypothetical protein [Blattabacterium cuenoti]